MQKPEQAGFSLAIEVEYASLEERCDGFHSPARLKVSTTATALTNFFLE
jgi:hypothetical protein